MDSRHSRNGWNKTPEVISVNLPKASRLANEGYEKEGNALYFDKWHTVFSDAHSILSELTDISETVVFRDHPLNARFSDISEACRRAGADQLPLCLATCSGSWAVGLATSEKHRLSAAKLALAISLLSKQDDSQVQILANKFPEFRDVCRQACLLDGNASLLATSAGSHEWLLAPKPSLTTPAALAVPAEAPAPEPKHDPRPSPGEICKHYRNGYCSWGKQCRFAHCKDPPTPLAPSRPAVNSSSNRSSDQAADKSTQASAASAGARSSDRGGCVGANTDQASEDNGSSDKQEDGCTDSKRDLRRPAARHWVHIVLHKRHTAFDLVPMLIGKHGINMRNIVYDTGAKLRIRGRGSGHLEDTRAGKKEAQVPLMLAVTANKADSPNFRRAIDMSVTLLRKVSDHYIQFCIQRELPTPTSNEPIFSVREVSRFSVTLLQDILLLYPDPAGPRTVNKVTHGGYAPRPRGMSDSEESNAQKELNEPVPHEDHCQRKRRTRTKHGNASQALSQRPVLQVPDATPMMTTPGNIMPMDIMAAASFGQQAQMAWARGQGQWVYTEYYDQWYDPYHGNDAWWSYSGYGYYDDCGGETGGEQELHPGPAALQTAGGQSSSGGALARAEADLSVTSGVSEWLTGARVDSLEHAQILVALAATAAEAQTPLAQTPVAATQAELEAKQLAAAQAVWANDEGQNVVVQADSSLRAVSLPHARNATGSHTIWGPANKPHIDMMLSRREGQQHRDAADQTDLWEVVAIEVSEFLRGKDKPMDDNE